MAKLPLNDVASGYNRQKINDNFTDIEAEFQDKVLYRDNPDGEPNQMETDIDMNSQNIYNLPDGTENSHPATYRQLVNALDAAYDGFTVRLREPRVTATAGQTVVNFGAITYVTGVNNIQVYVNGVAQVPGIDYTETDEDTITFTTALEAGDEVDVYSNEPVTNISVVDPVAQAKLDASVVRVSSRTEMKAYDAPVDYQFSLEEGGRSGIFVVKAGSPPSDPEEGVYVVLNNGNYAERLHNGDLWVDYFGAVKGADSGLAAQNTIAINACDAFCAANDEHAMLFGGGEYRHDGTLTFTGSHRIEGASGRFGTTLKVTADVLAVDYQAEGTVDGLVVDGDLVAGKTTDGIHISAPRLDFGYIVSQNHFNGMVYKKGNVSIVRRAVCVGNANIGFWADASDKDSNGSDFWIDSRGNGSHGIVFGEEDLGDITNQPRQNSGFVSAQANGGYGIVIYSRNNKFIHYGENNTLGTVQFKGAGSFGNFVYKQNVGAPDEASDTSGAPGKNFVSGILNTTAGVGYDNVHVTDTLTISDYNTRGVLDVTNPVDDEILFTLDGSGSPRTVRWTNEDTGGVSYIFDEGGVTISDDNAGVTSNPLASRVKLRLEDKDVSKAGNQETGTIEWYSNDSDNPGVQAAISTASNTSGTGFMDFWSGTPGTYKSLMRVFETSTAGETGLLLYDVDSGTIQRVTVGAADSGGTGFKLLRIPN